MEAVATIVGALLSVSFQALFDRLLSHDFVNYASEGQVHDELEKWEIMLKKVYLVLDDAEEKQITNPLVKMWVSELRDLAYDVEDILDEFATEALRRKLEGEPLASTSMMISKIKRITARLDEINEQKDVLLLGEGGRRTNQIRERLPTTSLVNEAQVYDRDKDKEAMIELLKLIFNDTTLESDLKAWVSVGKDFDVFGMTKTILQLKGHDEKDLNMLQLKLKEKLSMKNFLNVLDDVWTENYEDWTCFCSPIKVGAPGSTVIVTTRSHHVSSMMGAVQAYPLKELSYDDCMSVFAQHALGAPDFDGHMDVEEIGKGIVKKC
ncbi:hypothetical protein GH714_018523 [Hevea brasiliensis]|uniref:Rx N-terminal domain-containing protein n=1 Tax=Hevea brasiliensis TaxID=3981 RepID=A0A6A6N243_HEVBR|nr:hypothetical protein GH714_018523 [Hevea brasiliensis]